MILMGELRHLVLAIITPQIQRPHVLALPNQDRDQTACEKVKESRGPEHPIDADSLFPRIKNERYDQCKQQPIKRISV